MRFFMPTVVVSGLILLFFTAAMPIRATGEEASLAELIPDFEKIYREALVRPHQEAAKKISDADIAQFYKLMLEKTGLDVNLDEAAAPAR